MGGSIRVVHRIGGEINKQTRWTNSLPGYVQNEKFVEGDPEYVKEYLSRPSEWREKKEYFAPNGYGLDFYDFDKKIIHTIQGYTSYKDIEYSAVFLWLLGKVSTLDSIVDGKIFLTKCTDKDEYFFPHEVRKMWEKNMLSGISYIGDYDNSWIPENQKILSKEEMGNPSFEECLSMLEYTKGHDSKRHLMYAEYYKEGFPELLGFRINWEAFGWTIHKYQEDSAGLKAIKEAIQADITLSKKEEEKWKEYIEYRES